MSNINDSLNNLREKLIEAISLDQGWEESAVRMTDKVLLPIIRQHQTVQGDVVESLIDNLWNIHRRSAYGYIRTVDLEKIIRSHFESMGEAFTRKDKLWSGEPLPDEKHISKKELISRDISVVDEWALARTCGYILPYKGEELSANLLRRIIGVYEASRERKPVSVSLEVCAAALCFRGYFMNDIEEENFKDSAKAVLDAAGVKYVD